MTKFGLKSRVSARFAALSLALFAPMTAFAGDGAGAENAIAGVTSIADTIIDFMTGPIATAAGAIAIAVVGYRWFSGRMEMGKAVATVAGIVLVIGSVQIVNFIRTGSGITEGQSDQLGSIEAPVATQLASLNTDVLARRLYS